MATNPKMTASCGSTCQKQRNFKSNLCRHKYEDANSGKYWFPMVTLKILGRKNGEKRTLGIFVTPFASEYSWCIFDGLQSHPVNSSQRNRKIILYCNENIEPLFTKGSREIRVQTFPIALKIDRMSVKFQSDTDIITSDLAASRLHEIWL